ncbi:MAG: hypothetical protein ACLFVN_09160 [Phycisphaeraceae bacterium]
MTAIDPPRPQPGQQLVSLVEPQAQRVSTQTVVTSPEKGETQGEGGEPDTGDGESPGGEGGGSRPGQATPPTTRKLFSALNPAWATMPGQRLPVRS